MPRFALSLLAAAVLAAPLLTPSDAMADEWKIDAEHSEVGFKVRHMMVSWTRGSFGKFEGTVSYDPGTPESLVVEVTIKTKSVDTDNSKRDDHLRSADFFDVGKYPEMTFKSTKATAAKDGSIALLGNLTLHGVTKEVTLDVEPMSDVMTDPWGNVKIGTSASLRIARKDWGLTWSKSLDGGGVVVGDEIRITLDIELNKKK
jgi:polyisoprenoid-binding protein YceI